MGKLSGRKMKFAKKLQHRRQQKKKALYVRLPHVIRKEEDVAKLFTGDFKVKLLRQAKKYCYVIFADVEEKMKNLEATKDTLIDGKPIVVASAITKLQESTRRLPKKKIVIPKIEKDPKVTRTLFVSNIKCGTKLQELKEAIPGCMTIKMLEPYSQNFRSAMVKLENAQVAAEYLLGIKDGPIVRGYKLNLKCDTRSRLRRYKSNAPLKIYDGEPEENQDSNKKIKHEILDHIVLENKM